jgi:hypothetical protein
VSDNIAISIVDANKKNRSLIWWLINHFAYNKNITNIRSRLLSLHKLS